MHRIEGQLRHARYAAIIMAALLMCFAAAGCGGSGRSERSAAAYCDAFYSRAAPLEAKEEQAAGNASADPLGGLVSALSSIGDLETTFAAMDAKAPDAIEPDTAQVRDNLKNLQSSIGQGASNPLSALAGGVVSSLTSAGSYQRVSDYLQAHCSLTSPIAKRYGVKVPTGTVAATATAPTGTTTATGTTTTGTTGTTATTSTTASNAPSVGTTLGTDSSGFIANAAGDGFSLLDPSEGGSGLTAYAADGTEMTTIDSTDLDPSCGALDLNVPGQGRVLITQQTEDQPAAGLTPASSDLLIDAWDAQSGAKLWEDHVDHTSGEGDGFCGPSENDIGAAAYMSATTDGKWLVNSSGGPGTVINLVTGGKRTDPKLSGTIGNYVLDSLPDDDDPGRAVLSDPDTGAEAGSFRVGGEHGIGLYSDPDYGIDYALTGSFQTDSAGTTPPSGLSSDGGRLLVMTDNGVTAFQLPAMTQLWSAPVAYIDGDGGGVLVAEVDQSDGTEAMEGLDDSTGARLWKVTQPAGFCGVSNSEVMLNVNDDLTNLDIHTGKQDHFVANDGGDCPTVYPGGLTIDDSDNIVQSMTP